MKFEKFQNIRKSLKEAGSIEESVVSFREYKDAFMSATLENIAEEIINTPIDGNDIDLIGIACYEDSILDEASNDGKLKTMFKNIFGLLKIKSMGTPYMKAMADQALADMDFERKKEAAGGRAADPEIKDKLNVAHTAKKDALEDRVDALGEKIDNIATTDYLKKVAKKTKLLARIKKNEILLKIASEEESKTLKIKNAELGNEVKETDAAIGEYQKENKDDIDKAKEELPKQIKEEIKKLTDQISEVQGKIEAAEESLPGKYESLVIDEADEAEANKKRLAAYTEIMPLKTEKAELVAKRAEQKDAYNKITGKDEYSVNDDQEEVDSLKTEISKLGAKIEKMQTAGIKADEKNPETKEDPTADNAETDAVEVDAEAVAAQQKKIEKAKEDIVKLEKDIEGVDAKKNKKALDTVNAAIEGKKKSLKAMEDKLAELKKGKKKEETVKESEQPKAKKSTMTFEEFRALKTKYKLQ